ncbi:MAG TPA: hypothetical protein VK249_14365 [Anaerolineales bacterium]|nr:hypothetical protein [Anaerolineales bacterium]
MNLIDKYIVEVGKHLPRKNRADIQSEIRSTLEDMLDERKQTGPADETMVLALLKEYGSPREVAATYKTHQYLIGPRLFPLFEMVVRIVLTVVTAVSLLGLGVGLAKTGFTGTAFISPIKDWFLNIIGSLIAAFGNIALVFAILERTSVADKYEKDFNEWDPTELKSEPDPDQIDLPDHIFTIIFTLLALVILNLYPNLLSIRMQNNATWTAIPVLTETFFRFLPWINIMGLLQILLNGFLLSRREWTTPTRILSIVMDIAQASLLVLILRTPGIFGITPESLTALGLKESAEPLSRLVNTIPTIIMAIVVVITIIKVVQSSLRLFRDRSKSPYPVLK